MTSKKQLERKEENMGERIKYLRIFLQYSGFYNSLKTIIHSIFNKKNNPSQEGLKFLSTEISNSLKHELPLIAFGPLQFYNCSQDSLQILPLPHPQSFQ